MPRQLYFIHFAQSHGVAVKINWHQTSIWPFGHDILLLGRNHETDVGIPFAAIDLYNINISSSLWPAQL